MFDHDYSQPLNRIYRNLEFLLLVGKEHPQVAERLGDIERRIRAEVDFIALSEDYKNSDEEEEGE